ncbi:ABC transporter substrate-binding protein [Chelativorans sp. M5D2P16]|uniref:ABC transporter substrate-binding protein n=1 Tax=Chelativorans sp. M5D2P16 TaxID=3095678 RepID=UPI002ACAE250|nr:ABC transporter substrate-binding protein [Chelativorans sp. M5D2P16]MDZ5696683.1 ABC transporter substrate-binding protein [Chelativorans sp. M5D2P16]
MLKRLALSTTMVLACAGFAEAKVEIACLTTAAHLTRQHEPLMKRFNEMQDDIVAYAAPSQDYADTHLKLFRASATNTLPDCAFQAFNQLPSLARALDARSQIVHLDELIVKEEDGWKAANYTERMLDLGRVDGIQYGMPFNASVIQWYYNADLVRQAGGDPDNFPTTWDGVIELAKKIDALGDDIASLSYAADKWGDDWPWQTLILQQGGRMLNEAGDEVAFDKNNYHVEAMKLLRRLVEEGVYDPAISQSDQLTQFTEGKMGIYATSPASARNTAERVGELFDLRTTTFAVWNDAEGLLPSGGNAALITTKDPEKVAAAWEYIKFVTGPEGQEFAAKITGYLPTNRGALAEDRLGGYYAAEPYYATPSNQYDRAGPWSGYPGTQSEKIWREQREVIHAVMTGRKAPEDGAREMVEIAEKLMQR